MTLGVTVTVGVTLGVIVIDGVILGVGGGVLDGVGVGVTDGVGVGDAAQLSYTLYKLSTVKLFNVDTIGVPLDQLKLLGL